MAAKGQDLVASFSKWLPVAACQLFLQALHCCSHLNDLSGLTPLCHEDLKLPHRELTFRTALLGFKLKSCSLFY